MAPRRDDYDKEIKARQSVAGRYGFYLGCIAAIAAFLLNLWLLRRPLTVLTVVMLALAASLNIPLGIALGLIGERFTRPEPPKK